MGDSLRYWMPDSSSKRGCKFRLARETYHYSRRRQQKAAARTAPAAKSLDELKLARIAHHDNLIRVYYHLKRNAGQAPGIDGIRYDDLGSHEVAAIMRQLSRAVLECTYQPYPARHVPIPKANGGFRELMLRSICDRVVATALYQALYKPWEEHLSEHAHGFRQGRSHLTLLARLEQRMRQHDCWMLITDDIRQAFDHVRIADVLNVFGEHVKDEHTLTLIETTLKGGDAHRTTGIDQGSALSPLCLTALLTSVLERHFGDEPDSSLLLWYADNIALVSTSMSEREGQQALQQVRTALQAHNLELKGKDGPPRDLTRDTCQLLGFTLSSDGEQLQLAIPEESWEQLVESLEKAHEQDNPAKTAKQAVQGWLTSMGPAFVGGKAYHQDVLYRVLQIAASLGFFEVGTSEQLRDWWQSGYRTWMEVRDRWCR